MSKRTTLKVSFPRPQTSTWLVFVGKNADTEYYVETQLPDEDYIRRMLRIPPYVPILVGRP